MIPIVVMASGRGSNFDAICRAIAEKRLQARIAGVISDQEEAPVLAKAEAAGIPTISIPFPPAVKGMPISERRRQHEEKVLNELDRIQPKFLVMAGYMRILSPRLIEVFRCDQGYSRIVNIHPSLLPSFPGLDAYAQAFRYGAQVSGVTVHLVEADVDSGPICAQESFSIADCRSEAEVEQRGLALEHRLYPETLRWLLTENFSLEYRSGGRVCVRPN